MRFIDVVKISKKGAGSHYLLIPYELMEDAELKEGEKLLCYQTQNGIHYEKIKTCSKQVVNVELEVQNA